jgi:hypothetical protein
MHQRFDSLEFQLAYQHRDLAELLHANAYATALLGKRLDKVEADVLKAINAQSRRVLGPHRLRKDRNELTLEAFQDSLDVFLSAATRDARDEGEVGPTPKLEGSLKPTDAATNAEVARLLLPSDDLWGRLAVLCRVGPAFGIDLQPDLPNPRLWSLAARDYLDLAHKWPKYYLRYDPELRKLDQLLDAGYELRRAAARVVQIRDGAADPAPLLKLVQSYRANADRLDGLLKAASDRVNMGTAGYDPLVPLAEQDHGAFAPQRDPTFVTAGPLTAPRRSDGMIVADWDPLDPKGAPDPNVKIDPKVVALEADDVKRIDKLVPAEFRAAKKLGLGKVFVGTPTASIGEEYVVYKGQVIFVLDKGKVVYKIAKDHPIRDIPAYIREHFPFSIRFTVRTRYARLFLEYRAYFLPADRPDLKIPIFTLRASTAEYYGFGWRGAEFHLLNTDKRGGKLESFANWFNPLVPAFRKQFREGSAVEVDPKGVEFGRADVLQRLDKAFLARGRELVAAQKAAFATPGGEVAALAEAVTTQRLLLSHFLVLGLGDWLAATAEGAELAADVRALKTGEEMTKAVAASPERFLSRKTRESSVNLLFAPAETLEGTLRRVVRLPAPLASKETTSKEPAPLLGRHALVEDTLARLERFFDEQARSRNQVALPASLRER